VLSASAAPCGVYQPRHPTASPLYRLLQDQFDRTRGVYEDALEHRWGRWRKVVGDVLTRFLDCGVLEPGFARVRCGRSIAFSTRHCQLHVHLTSRSQLDTHAV